MARTSEGKPDQAESRSSGREIVEDWRIFLNLFIRVIRAEWASISFAEALGGMVGCAIRWRLLAGSRRMSLYCGRRIFWPSVGFLVVG